MLAIFWLTPPYKNKNRESIDILMLSQFLCILLILMENNYYKKADQLDSGSALETVLNLET